MKNTKLTRDDLKGMDSEEYSRLMKAYYTISDGLFRLEDLSDKLKKSEKEALGEMKRVFDKLNHLGEIL